MTASANKSVVTPLDFARRHPNKPVSALEVKEAEAKAVRDAEIAKCRENHPAGKRLISAG